MHEIHNSSMSRAQFNKVRLVSPGALEQTFHGSYNFRTMVEQIINTFATRLP